MNFEIKSYEAEKILGWCNTQLNDTKNWYSDADKKEIDNVNFRKGMAALGIKIIMFLGLPYRELRKIKWSDYDDIKGTINIRGFELRSPIKLNIQLQRIKFFVEENNIKSVDDYIFTDVEGKQWGETTSCSGIPDCLSFLIGNTSVTCLVKYGISQLIQSGLSNSIIKELTGIKDTVINKCIDPNDESITELFNRAVVCSDVYFKS